MTRQIMTSLQMKTTEEQKRRKQNMKITITYKTGLVLSDNVHDARVEDGNLIYTVEKNPHPVFQTPVTIPVENIDSVKIVPGEETLSDKLYTFAFPQGITEMKQDWIDDALGFMEAGYTSDDMDDLSDQYYISPDDTEGIRTAMKLIEKEKSNA